MKLSVTLLAGAAFLLSQPIIAQNIKDRDISFVYIQLPKEPVDKSIVNYQSNVVLSYAADNAAKKADYDAKMKIANEQYDVDMKAWKIEDDAAEVRYQKEMTEYNKKSMAQKIADEKLLNQGKPVRQQPNRPYRNNPQAPNLKKDYDTQLLASSYLRLDGFINLPDNAVIITVTMYGFDCIQPHLVTEQKNMTRTVEGKQQPYTSTFYHYETSYKHPMSVKVEAPGKGVIFTQVIDAFNQFVVVKTAQSENKLPVNFDPVAYVQNLEEKALTDNLKYINDLVNDKYGFARITRKTVLNNVESKKMNYDEFQAAFDNASVGYNMLATDKAGATAKIWLAINAWEKALLESNPADKKARIDAGVTMATRFNLVDAYMMIGDYTNAGAQLDKINSAEPDKKERARSAELKLMLEDLKVRAAANK
ncbi:MAG: hypothetical protein M3R17_16205 [Bacteroidota bacterium]|nr:hypothetical protein [Bacteroidota bacterium]